MRRRSSLETPAMIATIAMERTMAKDCMLKRKKDRENVTKDEAYYVTKLENFRNLNVKGTNLLVARDDEEGMEIWIRR